MRFGTNVSDGLVVPRLDGLPRRAVRLHGLCHPVCTKLTSRSLPFQFRHRVLRHDQASRDFYDNGGDYAPQLPDRSLAVGVTQRRWQRRQRYDESRAFTAGSHAFTEPWLRFAELIQGCLLNQ